jgi:hypothetical protein
MLEFLMSSKDTILATNVAAARELEREEEISEGNPITTLEPAFRRVFSTSSRADHKGQV